MSRIYASGSPYCAETRATVPAGRCVIIFRAAGERRESQTFFFHTRNVQGQFDSGMAAGLGAAVFFIAGRCRTLWKPERAALFAVGED
jgi:hypothetical protein